MNWFGQTAPVRREAMSGDPLVVGLVNNTSDRGLQATERQFIGLLQAAAPHLDLRVKLFTCPGIARSCRTPDGAHGRYGEIDALFDTKLDALIVTGMEPQAAMLQDEPVWPSLCRLVDWAEDRAIPTIWSCLAAHAAVLRLDGISRTRAAEKLSGIYACEAVCDHPLLGGLPVRWGSPHSRYNGLAEHALLDHGYAMLSRSDEAGADIFLRSGDAPFVFFQGHPEYGPDTLLHEYKRDVRRYLTGERDAFPAMPKNYFDGDTEAAVSAIRQQILDSRRDASMMTGLCSLVNELAYSSPWRKAATGFVANWLASVSEGDMQSCRLAAECSL